LDFIWREICWKDRKLLMLLDIQREQLEHSAQPFRERAAKFASSKEAGAEKANFCDLGEGHNESASNWVRVVDGNDAQMMRKKGEEVY
jgi:hypothetical protein